MYHNNNFVSINMYKRLSYHLFIPIKILSEIQVCHIITFYMITDRKYEFLDKNCQF